MSCLDSSMVYLNTTYAVKLYEISKKILLVCSTASGKTCVVKPLHIYLYWDSHNVGGIIARGCPTIEHAKWVHLLAHYFCCDIPTQLKYS